MEIDITRFVKTAEPCEFSASRAELGVDAGAITWRNAKREAAESPLLSDESALDSLRQWARESGGWTREEVSAWTPEECNALFVQIISGDLRELESLAYSDSDEYGVDWQAAERLAEQGTIHGALFKGTDGNVYYYLGS